MKKLDRNSLITVAVVGTMAYTYMGIKKAENKPVKILGLSESHSMNFVGAVALLAGASLVYCCVLNKVVAE